MSGKLEKLRNIAYLGTEGFFTWDGTDASGKPSRTVIYLILTEVFDIQVIRRKYKTTCVLSGNR